MDIKDKVVLVTGASRGLGREGAKVVVNYYNSQELADKVVESIGSEQSIALQADVREKEQVQHRFDRAKNHIGQPITTIVNNTLVGFSFNGNQKKDLETLDVDDFSLQVGGGVKASLNTLQCGQKDMAGANFGRIVNIRTNLFQNPVVPYHDYITSKASLLGMTRNMAKELGSHGITANMVSGRLLYKTDASAATPDAVFDSIQSSTPLQKVTIPEDVADAVLFFASPWSRSVTVKILL